VAKHSK